MLRMTIGQWLLLIEVAGTVFVICWRAFGTREKVTWRYVFSFIWPLVVQMFIVGVIAKLIGDKFLGDKNWDKPAPRADHEDEDHCPVCKGHLLVPFDKLEERANAVIDGKSEDLVADCKLFAPIVKHFVKQHRWDKDVRAGKEST